MGEKLYKEYKKIIEDYLLNFLPKVDLKSDKISESMIYSLQAGGKRLRPILLVAACNFVNSEVDIKECLPFAMAVEYIHTYSLIHDDLPAMDNDTLRRGKPTNHVVFGEDMAILAGDGLLNSAFEAMIKETLGDFDRQDYMIRKVKAMHSIAKAAGCQGMIAGQVADVESEGKKVSSEMLDYINSNKTSAMIIGAITAGGYIGGGKEEVIRDLTSYGENLGLAFQIRDDILDILGDEKDLGKNIGSDEEQGKATYPSIYGMEYSHKKLEEATKNAIDIMKKYDEKGEFFIYLANKLAIRKG